MGGLIYRAYNKITGKSYIGQTTKTLDRRKYYHYSDASRDTKNTYFYNALNKYEKHDWEWSILCENIPVECLDEYEIWFINYYSTYSYGYNSTTGGRDRYCVSKETRCKLSKSLKKIWKENGHPWRGRNHSEKTKIKMSNYHSNRPPEINKKISESAKIRLSSPENHPMYGKTMSIETRYKISESHKGKKLTEEHRKSIGESVVGEKNPFYGKCHSEEARENMSYKHGGRPFNVYKDGAMIGRWVTQMQCARDLDLDNVKISLCLHDKRNTHKGYTFKYVEVNNDNC